MKTIDLLVSNVNITEDDYSYKGLFILSFEEKSLNLDMTELENNDKIEEIKNQFGLHEENSIIKKIIMDKVFEKASISSVMTEGEGYEESSKRKKVEKGASSLDMA
jgi:hypothetical protein